MTDGTVTIRPFEPADAAVLIAARDDESRRWLGPGTDDPRPVACIVVNGDVVGWVDYDVEREWLQPDEVNVGYCVFPTFRQKGYASRAVALLLQHLDETTPYRTATLLIDPQNVASLAVAAHCGFEPSGDIDGSRFFKSPVRR